MFKVEERSLLPLIKVTDERELYVEGKQKFQHASFFVGLSLGVPGVALVVIYYDKLHYTG